MQRVFNENGQLRLNVFDPALLRHLNNLKEVTDIAWTTGSPLIESTHFLIALCRIPNGLTRQFFSKQGLSYTDLEKGLGECIDSVKNVKKIESIQLELLEKSSKDLMNVLNTHLESDRQSKISESRLLLAALESLTPKVIENLAVIQIRKNDLIAKFKQYMERLCQYSTPVPFINGFLKWDAFSPSGRKIIQLMKTEAESFGYRIIDARHLLLAMVEYEGGTAQMSIYRQDILPKKIQEKLTINLKSRAGKSGSDIKLQKSAFDPSVSKIIERAANQCSAEFQSRIREIHLFRSFLEQETFALRFLKDAGFDVGLAQKMAKTIDPDEEAAAAVSFENDTPEKIREKLKSTLVGQDIVIDMCIPFINRMLFGFRQKGKPAGVFLFCGPSGVGKTETAKAIARAVFSDEDNLIMLEMGQFQTRESMNIFIGAPPGYIGYGEGKLTNGLRDKPRSVVLFDEIEKAHSQVFDALLRFIDEGKIDDPAGPVRDGSECIIIMTSNVRTDGVESFLEKDNQKRNKWQIRKLLKEALLNLSSESPAGDTKRDPFRFRPEFLNRIDEVVLFRALDENDLTEISLRHLKSYRRRLMDEWQINLIYSPKIEAVARLIGRFCTTIDEGARAALRVSQTSVIDKVIDFIFENGPLELKSPKPISLVIHFPQNPNSIEEPKGIVDFYDE